MRLAIYMDHIYAADAAGVSTEHAVMLFALELAPRLGEVTVLGRLDPEPRRAPYPIAGPGVRFAALPHYESLRELMMFACVVRRSCVVLGRELHQLDAVWLFTPSPLSLIFAAMARRRGVPVIFGVRQDTSQYFAHRLPSPRWAWVLPLARAADQLQRLLARRVPTTVVGHDLARKFGADRNPVLEMGVSLVRRADITTLASARSKAWNGELRLLMVGRIEQEKNPLLIVDVIAALRSGDPRWTVDVVGEGPLAEPLRQYANELGVGDAVRLCGYVSQGPELQAIYRQAHAFVHVSLTEGLPQVIFEAQAAGLPIVGTDVGGVSAALANGVSGLLVPPRDVSAMTEALERLRDNVALRNRLIEAGLRTVETQTMDHHVARVSSFIGESVRAFEHRARLPLLVRTRPMPRHASCVLMYHDVLDGSNREPSGWTGRAADRYKLALPAFEQHLDVIAAGVGIVGLLGEDGDGPDVAITFDDGGSSALLIADVLERRGWRGHFFVTTSRIGTPGFLDAEGVRALVRRGHVVGSHSHTHPTYLAQLSVSALRQEWERSRDVLDELLGAPPVIASVPGGMYSTEVGRAAERAGYRLLLTSEPHAPVVQLGDLTVVGRWTVWSNTGSRTVAGYIRGDRLTQNWARFQWLIKVTAKRLAPRLYRIATGAAAVRPASGRDVGL
jgi:glycosyltransferase involved in cell wall biosynthesis/peptidoglycan/xylan/chitin deacetylase (PgdA/CDA1 family)